MARHEQPRLRSPKKARRYLRKCIDSLPNKWFQNFQASDIHKLLMLFGENNRTLEPSLQPIYNIQRNMMKLDPKKPTKLELLALIIHSSLPAKGRKKRKKPSQSLGNAIRKNGWSDLVTWKDGLQLPDQGTTWTLWKQWFEDHWSSLFKDTSARRALKPAEYRFYCDVCTRIQVQEVTESRIVWSTAFDLSQGLGDEVVRQMYYQKDERTRRGQPLLEDTSSSSSSSSGSDYEEDGTSQPHNDFPAQPDDDFPAH